MANRAPKIPLNAWETATKDGMSDPFYIRLGQSLLDHPAYCTMKPLSQVIYIQMVKQAKGKTAFEFPHSVYSKYCSNDGFNKAKVQLIERGFIEVITDNRFTGKENKYKFSSAWKEYIPPPF